MPLLAELATPASYVEFTLNMEFHLRDRESLAERAKSFVHVARVCLTTLTVVYVLGSQAFASAQASPQGTRLEGVVMDQSRAPVADAEVTLSNDASVISQVKTGTDGRFVFKNVQARDARLTIRAPGFASVEREWSAKNSASPRLEIILTPAPITEQVTVTAARTEARLDETAASISLIS